MFFTAVVLVFFTAVVLVFFTAVTLNVLLSLILSKMFKFYLLQKLKNKLGTRQVPTAELLLDGTRAILVTFGNFVFVCLVL